MHIHMRSILLAACALQTLAAPTKRDDQLKFNFGSEKVRGVNLGGWFVLEPWITPSFFDDARVPSWVVDEYTYCQWRGENAVDDLQQHWDTWINETDFAKIASHGINLVRIPLGYWSVQKFNDPYAQGAYEKLGEALGWAQTHNLKVMIDLHGAPESQNGFDNSGHKGSIGWGQGDTIAHTITVLNQIRDDHAAHPAVAAIELVNEPMASSVGDAKLRQFYMDGWGNLESSHVAITFHDGFEGVNAWNDWGAGMWNLLLDTHHYEVFDAPQLQLSPQQHVAAACAFGEQMRANNKWTVAGEWTGAMTDCAKWLNGRGVGARYDGSYRVGSAGSSYIGSCAGKASGTVAGLSDADRGGIRNFINAQLDAFELGAGWIWWTWKTEAAPEWDMQALLAAGVFPSPVSTRNVEGLCGNGQY